MKILKILTIVLLLGMRTPCQAGSLFFQPMNAVDWSLLAGTALADLGDMSTSSDIAYKAEHGDPGMHEINPFIDHLWGTNIPSQMQYALTFAGIFAGQSLIAWALPVPIREVALIGFITIGVVDINNNQALGLRFVW